MALTKKQRDEIVRKGYAEGQKDAKKAKLQALYSAPVGVANTDDRKQKMTALSAVFADMISKGASGGNISFKAMASNVDATGGFATEDDLASFIIEKRDALRPVLGIVNRYPTTSSKVKLPLEVSSPTATEGQAQGTTITASDPTLGELEIDVFDSAILTEVNNQTVSEWAKTPQLAEFLTGQFAKVMAGIEEKQVMQGTGTNQATGLDNDVKKTGGFTQQVADGGTTADSFSVSSLINLVYELPEEWATNAVIVMRRDAMHNLYDFGTGRPNPLFTPTTGAPSVPGAVGTFLGYPVINTNRINKNYDLNGVVANKAAVVYFGDFSQYYLAENQALDIQSSIHANFAKNQTVFRGTKRFGGKVALKEAFAIMAYRGTA